MEALIIPCITGLTSSVYLGFNALRYLNFMKFKQNRYIDKYHSLRGKVSSPHRLKTLVDSHDVIFKDLTVSVGKDKTDIINQPVQVGNKTIMVPRAYKYTKWHDTHHETRISNELSLVNKPIQLIFPTNFIWFHTHTFNLVEKWRHDHQYYLDLFTKNNIKHYYGDRIRITEKFIKSDDELAIFGEYKNGNKDFEVLYMGKESDVDDQVKNDICHFNGLSIEFAVFILIMSIIGAVVIYDENSQTYKRR